MATELWKPGQNAYQVWLSKLTPEEYRAHMAERQARKKERNLEKQLKEVFMANAEQWISEFNNATAKMLKKAQDGDVSAYTAVGDRVFGKPKNNVDVTSNGNTVDPSASIVASADALIEKLKSRNEK